MPTREQIIRQYGGWENVPAYLRRGFEAQDRAQARRERQQRAHQAAQEAERARVKALRRSPQNVRLEPVGTWGARIVWEPPETAEELPPAGYWISEERNGKWTAHGDYLLPDRRSGSLFGRGPARVETWYHQMALYESYPSETVTLPAESPETGSAVGAVTGIPVTEQDQALIETVRGYLTESGRPHMYYVRWRRTLAALLGEQHMNPMTADEAQGYVDRGWGDRWPPIVEALRSREGAG